METELQHEIHSFYIRKLIFLIIDYTKNGWICLPMTFIM